MSKRFIAFAAAATACLTPGPARAQTASAAARPWARVSFFANSSSTADSGGTATRFSELTTTFTYQLPDEDRNRADYGLDIRYATYTPSSRPARTSIYEGYVGGRLADGALRFRAGHMWLNDLGALGSVAGAAFEFAQPRLLPDDGRFRIGGFGGLEPNVLDTGYAANVKKYGAYLAYDGGDTRRHAIGYVAIRNGSLTERSVLTTSHFIPLHDRVFVYQSAEYDMTPPAGQAERGLAYIFATARVLATERIEFQGTFNRGRSIDARGLSEDLLAGRPVTQLAIDGFLYQSAGGRVTVEPVSRVRIYAGYSRDTNSRDGQPSDRTLVGGYAPDVARSGFDVSASDSIVNRAGGGYQSRYVSVGHQIGRRAYISVDYTTSLSVIQFTRSDGLVIETQPHTARYTGTVNINLSRGVSLLGTVERSTGDTYTELRVLTGLSYRIRL